MRRILSLTIALLFATLSYSQIFSTGQTLKQGAMSLGLEPAVVNNDFGFYFHGGYGLRPAADLGIQLGFGHGHPYFEGNIEWALLSSNPYLSVTTGAHYNGNFGFNGGATLTFPVSRVYLSTGLDANLDFQSYDSNLDGKNELHTVVPIWLPFGLEVYLKQHMSLVVEAEVPLHDAYTFVGAGLNIYF
jgi:hypothetical protein